MIIKHGEWYWPAEWLMKYPQLSNILVRDLNEEVCDETVWVTGVGPKTKYKAKTVWNDISGSNNGAKVKWSLLIWFPQSIPRHTFVLWIAVQERLMTQYKIAKSRMNEVMECTLCKQFMDSHEHLFLKCDYSSIVWSKMQALLDRRFSNNWKNIIEEFYLMTANSNIWSILGRIVIGAVVYYLWQEKDNRLFNKGTRT